MFNKYNIASGIYIEWLSGYKPPLPSENNFFFSQVMVYFSNSDSRYLGQTQ